MKIFNNVKRIQQKQRIGVQFSLAGVVLMVAALAASLLPQYTLLAWGVTLIGLAIAAFGTYHVNRWLRPPLPEPILEKTFSRFDARHVVFNHFPPVPHLVLTPKGLVTIKVKRYDGPVRYLPESGKWKGTFSIGRFYGQGLTAEGLGNPTEEIQEEVERIRQWLRARLPDVTDSVPVTGLALFISPKVALDVANAPIPVAQPATLRKVFQSLLQDEPPLPRESYDRVRAALEAEAERVAPQAA